ncbi:MAG TPA: hypothetical protein VEX18_08535 [Polyangiaceae bacterium]|nr:hypothetical protein [Polyangiaceae bacterium]
MQWYPQRRRGILRSTVMRIGSIALVPSLLAPAACGGATTRDDALPQLGIAGARGVQPSDGNAGKATSLGPLVPLISGHRSSFAFSPIDPALPINEACDDPHTEVGEPLVLEGRTGVTYQTFCGRNPFLIVGTDDQLTAVEIRDGRLGMSFQYIHSPVAEGESWPSGTGELFTWREAGSLVTPGGAFDNCWEREGRQSRFFYCRGAGLVRAIDPEFNYVLDLEVRD